MEIYIMADMGTKQAAEKWGYSMKTIERWCREGKIPEATHDGKGSPWHIPKNAKCPRPIKKIIKN